MLIGIVLLSFALNPLQIAQVCANLSPPCHCWPEVSPEDWSIECNWDGDWVCCNGITLYDSHVYYERVLGDTGWDKDSIYPEWHQVIYRLPMCIDPDGGCEWGEQLAEWCQPGWAKHPLANPCPLP